MGTSLLSVLCPGPKPGVKRFGEGVPSAGPSLKNHVFNGQTLSFVYNVKFHGAGSVMSKATRGASEEQSADDGEGRMGWGPGGVSGIAVERKGKGGRGRTRPLELNLPVRWTGGCPSLSHSWGHGWFCSHGCRSVGTAGSGCVTCTLRELKSRCRAWIPSAEKRQAPQASARRPRVQECVNTSHWLLSDPGSW